MDNHTYNLIAALSEKADGAWVYDSYMEDSKDCEACTAMWKEMKQQDVAHVEKMKQLLIDHVKKGVIT